jgi:ferritin-like metal-binding protein YciE
MGGSIALDVKETGMSDTLVHYLREARAIENGLVPVLSMHIAATPIGEHRARLEAHLDETRRHEQQVARRLAELEQDADPLRQALSLAAAPIGFGLGVARGAARAMLSVLGAPLAIFRPDGATDTDRVLRNIRAEAASEALEVTTYTAIERLAAAEGDEETAALAAQIREAEQAMLAYLEHAAGSFAEEMADPRISDLVSREPSPDTNGAPPEYEVRETKYEQPEPEPIHVSEEPELVMESAEPGAEDEPGPEIHVDEPWADYDRMKAAEIERRLEDAGDELVAVVRLYEAGGKNRQTVLRAADRRLRILSDLPRGRR